MVSPLVYVFAVLIADSWREQVARCVPEPYLDEVFHIPQAQAYCNQRYDLWDPKLTTPAGLYIAASLLLKYVAHLHCSVANLRFLNTIFLLFVLSQSSQCHNLIHGNSNRGKNTTHSCPKNLKNNTMIPRPSQATAISTHTALNIFLFPPLFFFSGLFYTDVLSTVLVVAMFKSHLQRDSSSAQSALYGWYMYVLGIVTLWMRQTNIFWVLFIAGLETVKSLESISSIEACDAERGKETAAATWSKWITLKCRSWKRGKIHDITLTKVAMKDFILCPLSIAVAARYNPGLILARLWPYIALLLSFAGFVVWNGGVVLGDKNNHIPTLHLPQILYLSAAITFFSLPLFLPHILDLLPPFSLRSILVIGPSSIQDQIRYPLLRLSSFFLLLPITLVLIHHSTLVHPFTLADNRHYMFYIFRYTILLHPSTRYLLAPIYILCLTLCYAALLPTSSSEPVLAPQSNNLKTSHILFLFLATSLSLITAPLVEPRYFIIPWILWRLYVSVPFTSRAPSSISSIPHDSNEKVLKALSRHRYLILETLWFLLVNGGTGYIFLYRGFEWSGEGGVQRFLW